jgi:hypothetical protein
VIKVLPKKAKPTVVVLWDPMPDVRGKEDLSDETQQVLAPASGIRMWKGRGEWILMLRL